MAQKKKVSAKSPAKTKPKTKPAAVAKPAKKTEPKVIKSAAKKPAAPKVVAKPVAKPKVAAKPVAPTTKSVKPVPNKSAVKPTAVKPVAVKPEKKAPAPVAKPAQPAVKPAVAAKPQAAQTAAKPGVKPVASVVPPAAKPAAKPAAVNGKAVPAQPAAAKPGVVSGKPPAKPAMPVFRSGPVQFGTSAPAARTVPSALPKPAIRSFPAAPVNGGGAASGSPRDIAQRTLEARQQQVAGALAGGPKKPVTSRHGFKINESIVYPAHGVGRIIGIEEQEIAGMLLELFVIQFEKDKMTLKVPSGKLQTVGMRKLAEDNIVTKAMETLKGRARVKRTMWSRRAQEYEAKINSGDLVSIAEVVRDLYRSESQPEQSYSERQLYEAALDRMAREIAAVARIDERGAVQRITEVLAKSAKGRRAVEAADAGDGEMESDAKAA